LNGLRYHLENGSCEHDAEVFAKMDVGPISSEIAAAAVADVKVISRSFLCRIEGCGKRYKNLNGIKYHARMHHPNVPFVDVRGY
jgi:hypothetical protein